MKFDGSFVVNAPREEVWPYFNDPDILADCAPGCKEMTLESASEIRTTLEVGVGSVKPTFEVDAVVVECTKPSRLEIRGNGEASRNSFSVTAWQELSDNGDGTTTVEWEADAEVSGIIASLGQRALESVTDKLVSDFFQDIEDHVTTGTPAEAKLQAASKDEIDAAAEAAAATQGDIIGTAFEALGTLRDEGTDTDEGATGSTGFGPAAGAGFVGGIVGAALWSRLRSGDGTANASAGSTNRGDAPDGQARYLLFGAVLGVAGTLLWQLSGERVTETVRERAQIGVDGTADDAEPSTTTSVTKPGGSEPAAIGRNGATSGGSVPGDTEPERGLIDNPLDRLD